MKHLTKKQAIALAAATNRLEHALLNLRIATKEASAVLSDDDAYIWLMTESREIINKQERADKRAARRKKRK